MRRYNLVISFVSNLRGNSVYNIGEMALGKTFPSGFNLQQRPTQFAICRPKKTTVSVRSRERWNRKWGKGG